MPAISNLSPGEEARALKLADIALQNPGATNAFWRAGSRAHADHQRLIKELARGRETPTSKTCRIRCRSAMP